MAKRKRATALFEVMNKSRGFERGSSSATVSKPRGIRSWFKSRQPQVPVPVPMPRRQAAPEFAAARAGDAGATGEAAVSVPTMTQPPIPGDEQQYQDALDTPAYHADESSSYHDDDHEPHHDDESSDAEAPLGRSVSVAVDHERRLVSLRMNYTVAIVSAFAVVVAIALAVAVGRNMGREPNPVLAPAATSNLRQQAARPQVLNVHAGSTADPHDALRAPTLLSDQTTPAGVAPTFNEPHPPSNYVNHDAHRVVGLNYVIIQSYPSEKLATDAADFLNKHEVPCTIERHLKSWPESLYLVVGIDGFSRISAPEYKAYIAKIEKLSAQYASPKSFKAFDPIGKKWDKAE